MGNVCNNLSYGIVKPINASSFVSSKKNSQKSKHESTPSSSKEMNNDKILNFSKGSIFTNGNNIMDHFPQTFTKEMIPATDFRSRKFSSSSEMSGNSLSQKTPTEQEIDVLASYSNIKAFHKKIEFQDSYWLFSVYMYPTGIQFYIFDLQDKCYVSEISTVGIDASNNNKNLGYNMSTTAKATTDLIVKSSQIFHQAADVIAKKLYTIVKLNQGYIITFFFFFFTIYFIFFYSLPQIRSNVSFLRLWTKKKMD